MNNKELYHFGVPGMKWGVRRYQPYGEGGYIPKSKRSGGGRLKKAAHVVGAAAGVAGLAGAGVATAKGIKAHKTKMDSMSPDERDAYRDKLFDSGNSGKGKRSKSPAEKMTDNAAQIGRELQNVNRSVDRMERRRKQKPGRSASGMTDAELRAAINRLEMERRYEALTREEVHTGADTLNDILGVGVSTLTIASLGLGMYATYKGLDKK